MHLRVALVSLLASQADAFSVVGTPRILTSTRPSTVLAAIPPSFELAEPAVSAAGSSDSASAVAATTDAVQAIVEAATSGPTSSAATDMAIPSNVDIVDVAALSGIPEQVIIGGVFAVALAIGAVAFMSKLSSVPEQAEPSLTAPSSSSSSKTVAATKPPASSNTSIPPQIVVSASTAPQVDVSVPYDAAARLAFAEQARQQTASSGMFFADVTVDEASFEAFKVQYEKETVAAIKAKQQAKKATA